MNQGNSKKRKDTELTKTNDSISTETARQLILDSLPFQAWFKDLDGKYIAVNKSFAEYTGLTAEEIIGKTDFQIFNEPEAKIYAASDTVVISGSKQDIFEAAVGEEWKEEFKTLVFDEAGSAIGTAGYARYITDRKEMESALKESERSKANINLKFAGYCIPLYQ